LAVSHIVIDPITELMVVLLQFILFEAVLIFRIGALALWTWRKSLRIRKARDLEFDDLAFSCIAVTHAEDGLVVMDMAGIIQWVNPAYRKFMGREAVEMVGRHPESFALLHQEAPTRNH
jgi:PAS domain-containing protein